MGHGRLIIAETDYMEHDDLSIASSSSTASSLVRPFDHFLSEDDSANDVNDMTIDDVDIPESLKTKVAKLAITHRLTHAAVNGILGLLRDLGHDINKDARTILGTTREVSDEHFEHFGLLKGLVIKIRKGVPQNVHELQLQINIDGVPLYNSSRIQFWPILGRLINVKDKRPFVISVYCGTGKPPNVDEYLKPFLDEMSLLDTRSLDVDGRSFRVKLKAIICDAPARSYVKQTISHGGFYGCDRCEQKGLKVGGSPTFPKLINEVTLRNGFSFRQKRNKQHHKGSSPFIKIESLDMNFGFPLDYMHLICLGVMKRLLLLWRGEETLKKPTKFRKTKRTANKSLDLAHRLTFESQQEINRRIFICSKDFPIEFNRKGKRLL